MELGTGLDKMIASNVGIQGTGPEIVLWQEVAAAGVVVHFPHALGLEVLVVIALAVNVIDTLMIAMMVDVTGIGIALIPEITNMEVVIVILVTGIQLVEIDLQVIDMEEAQITRKMVMAKKEVMTGMVVHEVLVTGMEVE